MPFMPYFKPLSPFQSALAIFGALVCGNATLRGVLGDNLASGIYPANADSIGMPIAFALADSMFILILGVAGALLPRRRIGWRIANYLLLVVAGFFGAELAYRWLYPNHYLAGTAFLLVPFACMLSLWQPSTNAHPR